MTLVDVSDSPAYGTAATTRRHTTYYFEDGNYVIQVHHILFKVLASTFRRHSDFFDIAHSSIKVDKGTLGSDDDHPLVLTDVDSWDFDCLLSVLYPSKFGTLNVGGKHGWVAILKLSSRWKFKDVRELAIEKLAACNLENVEKIELMQRYRIDPQWAYSAFIGLCARPHALGVHEGKTLGIETTINIASVRERLEQWGRKRPDEVKKAVKEILELDEPVGDGNGQHV